MWREIKGYPLAAFAVCLFAYATAQMDLALFGCAIPAIREEFGLSLTGVTQMVRDRDTAYRFFTDTLGFATFYNGKPYVADEPEYMPLGIPKNLTTSVRCRAGIVYPVPGEFGRTEMIEIMDLDGRDHADRCHAPISVSLPSVSR